MQTQPENSSNVLDIRTKQTLMPKQLRSILKGQYVESKDMNHDPDTFIELLEQRLLGELARTTINFTKGWVDQYSNKVAKK